MTPSLLEAGPKAVAGLDELVEHLDEVVFRLDADGCWTFLNAAWERRLGWARRECLGRSAVPFIHRRDRA
ncbi:MAG: PAS domain-containing protein, partial [Verrucomicrobia bacterium]|nr:PAS domain-containing protein [Verrucomicrobiota bacterium]